MKITKPLAIKDIAVRLLSGLENGSWNVQVEDDYADFKHYMAYRRKDILGPS